jgi:division protein CdvB (Snf7/Vps24/ESCRT-III family)
MFEEFMHNLKQTLMHMFGVLDSGHLSDVIDDAGLDLDSHLDNFYEVRYGVFKKASAELRVSVLLTTEREAEEVATLCDGRVGLLLIPRK